MSFPQWPPAPLTSCGAPDCTTDHEHEVVFAPTTAGAARNPYVVFHFCKTCDGGKPLMEREPCGQTVNMPLISLN